MKELLTSLLIVYLLIINLVGFCVTIADKQKARRKQWRIPEATLFGIAFVGGSVGVYLAMQLARHKTQHTKFVIGIPAIILLQVGIFVAFSKFFS